MARSTISCRRRSVPARRSTNTAAARWLPPAEPFISRITPTNACGESNTAKRRSRSRPNPNCDLPILSTTRRAIASLPFARTTPQSDHEPANRIVAVSLADGKVTPLVEGADFYSNPRLSPDGRQLAWLSWNHPNMPWDGTELFVAPVASDGSLGKPRKVAGGADESIFQPSWSPDGTLYFVSDRTNWWNLYADRDGKIEPVLPMDAEFGAPQWVFGTTTYGFQPDGSIIARYTRGGTWNVTRIDPQSGKHEPIKLPYSNISSIDVAGNRAYAIAGSPTEPESLIEIDLDNRQVASDSPQLADSSPTPVTHRSPKPSSFPPTAAKPPTPSTTRPRIATSAAQTAKRRRSWSSFTAAQQPPPPPNSGSPRNFGRRADSACAT